MPVGSALLCGLVYLLLLAKVQKRWAVTISGAVLCIIWFVTGMHWAMALGCLIIWSRWNTNYLPCNCFLRMVCFAYRNPFGQVIL